MKLSEKLYLKLMPSDAIILDGQEEKTVYVYDGKPLKNIREGSEFYLEVTPEDAVMQSSATGSVVDTKEHELAAVTYNGKLVGTLSGYYGFLKFYTRRGRRVAIKVKCTGMYMRGIPNIVAMMPPYAEMKALKEAL